MIVNLMGPPCSGKTTFAARYILEHPEFRFCSIDSYRVVHRNEDKAWEALCKDVQSSKHVLLESCGTNWRLKELLRTPEIKKRTRINIAFSSQYEDLVARLHERQKRPVPYEYDLRDEFRAIDYVDEHLNLDNVDMVVESSRYNPDEQYRYIRKYLAMKRIEER